MEVPPPEERRHRPESPAFGAGERVKRSPPRPARVFLWSCGLSAVLVALSAALARSPRPMAGEQDAGGDVRSLLRRPGLAHALVTSCVVLAAVAMLLTPLPMPLWLLAPVLVVLGFGLGVGQPLTMSWLAEPAPPGSWRPARAPGVC
ncbi:hypothetical protein ABGB14_13520 [Nonomuraea sp. B10E15]|uniref:hypothetical protein n=1 Tax=Nonomuraea sp. B10E15 TaxID=3153560 RepID=UPI00325E216A